MLYVALATEDELSEAVLLRLLAELNKPVEASLLLRKNGFGYLRSKMNSWCQLAQHQPMILLTDLDQNICPSSLQDDWFANRHRPEGLLFRVAVREIESWLLSDHAAIRDVLGSKGKLPSNPDDLMDPKAYLLQLARRAPKDVRADLIKEDGAVAFQGIGYNARLTDFVGNAWNPQRASTRSTSLRKARKRLEEFVNVAGEG